MTRQKPVVVPVLVQEVGKIDGSLSRYEYGVGWHGLAAGLARCGGRFSAGEPRDFEGRQPDCARPLHRADIPLPQEYRYLKYNTIQYNTPQPLVNPRSTHMVLVQLGSISDSEFSAMLGVLPLFGEG